MKKIVLSVMVGFLVVVLGACGIGNTAWHDQFSLETDKITVWYGSADYDSFDITDSAELASLVEAVDFPAWEKVEDTYDGINSYYLDFNNGTVIGMYNDIAYGDVGHKNRKQEYPLPEYNVIHYYDLPPALLAEVTALVEKYGTEGFL